MNNGTPDKMEVRQHIQACSMRPRSGKEYTRVKLKTGKVEEKIDVKEPADLIDSLTNNKINLKENKFSLICNLNKKSDELKYSLSYNKEREIAYAALKRINDGSIKLDEKSEIEDVKCSFPSLQFKYDNVSYDDKSSINISNPASSKNKNCIDYITLDFNTTLLSQETKKAQTFDSKVNYACIDFDKTKAISKTGKEHSKEREVNCSNIDAGSANNSENVFFSNNSTNFYVPISPELLNYVSSSDQSHTGVPQNKNSFHTLDKQRKSSLDLLDSNKKSSLHNYSTLPHNLKRNVE